MAKKTIPFPPAAEPEAIVKHRREIVIRLGSKRYAIAERLRLACRDASDAFMEHWQQDHHVSRMAASSSSNK